jgi:hypothetical protein
MRIYLAAMFQNFGKGIVGLTANPNYEVFEGYNYPWVLESFHYIRKGRYVDYIREMGKKMFLDSGAFSMFTMGEDIPIEEYAQFCHDHADIVEVASNLDAIGSGREQETYDNQKRLEELGVQAVPVFHARDRDEWLERYLDEGYTRISLGGMVPESTKYLKAWLDRIWGRYLTDDQGYPRVKVHGFGLTTLELMARYPWFSVDSSSWVQAGGFGSILIDLPGGRDVMVKVSEDSPSKKMWGQHLDNLDPITYRTVVGRIQELGFDPENLRVYHGHRRMFNAEFMRRMQDRTVDRFVLQPGLFDHA